MPVFTYISMMQNNNQVKHKFPNIKNGKISLISNYKFEEFIKNLVKDCLEWLKIHLVHPVMNLL